MNENLNQGLSSFCKENLFLTSGSGSLLTIGKPEKDIQITIQSKLKSPQLLYAEPLLICENGYPKITNIILIATFNKKRKNLKVQYYVPHFNFPLVLELISMDDHENKTGKKSVTLKFKLTGQLIGQKNDVLEIPFKWKKCNIIISDLESNLHESFAIGPKICTSNVIH